MEKEKNNLFFINLLSVISAFAVITLHTNGVFWIFSKARYWLTANIIECVFYFAVPVFFMITGATLLDYNEKYNLSVFLKKRTSKTLVPFLLWSLLGLFYRILLLKDIKLEQLTFSFIWNGIWETKFVSIYWFFIPLFCIYLSIPLFAAISRDKKILLFKYILIASFTFNIFTPFIKTVSRASIQIPIHIAVGSGYLFYLLAGYYFTNIELKKSTRIVIYIGSFVGLILHIFGTYSLSMEMGKIVQTYKGYNNLPCVLYSLGIFLFFK